MTKYNSIGAGGTTSFPSFKRYTKEQKWLVFYTLARKRGTIHDDTVAVFIMVLTNGSSKTLFHLSNN